jgi:hypothetical protein
MYMLLLDWVQAMVMLILHLELSHQTRWPDVQLAGGPSTTSLLGFYLGKYLPHNYNSYTTILAVPSNLEIHFHQLRTARMDDLDR